MAGDSGGDQTSSPLSSVWFFFALSMSWATWGSGPQMAAHERELIGDELLVVRSLVDVKVIDAGVGAQLAQRSAIRRRDCRPWLGDLVALTDTDKPWAMQSTRMACRPIGPAKKPARRGTVAPTRILPDRHHVTPTGIATRRVDERRLIRRADHRQMATQDGREQHPDGDPKRRSVRLARHVKKRHLAYRCGDTGILGSRGECVAPAHRGAERRHAIRVNAG